LNPEGSSVTATSPKRELEASLLHQLDATYTFARWIVGYPEDAEDLTAAIVGRSSSLNAYASNHARTYLFREIRLAAPMQVRDIPPTFDDLLPQRRGDSNIGTRIASTQLGSGDIEKLRRAVADLPRELREVILLRDTEGLSYRDMTTVLALAPSVMMSRLWRARDALQAAFDSSQEMPAEHQQAPALIDAYIDSEVDITTAASFVQHVAMCSECARRLLSRSKLLQNVRCVTLCSAPEWLRTRIAQRLRFSRHPEAGRGRSADLSQPDTDVSAPRSGQRESPC
jgi:RNA polymerase sigma-70 factor (ECF subfamily)